MLNPNPTSPIFYDPGAVTANRRASCSLLSRPAQNYKPELVELSPFLQRWACLSSVAESGLDAEKPTDCEACFCFHFSPCGYCRCRTMLHVTIWLTRSSPKTLPCHGHGRFLVTPKPSHELCLYRGTREIVAWKRKLAGAHPGCWLHANAPLFQRRKGRKDL
jgi:hypothetical protein